MSALARALLAGTRIRRRMGRTPAGLPPYRELFGPHVPGRSFADVGAMWSVHGRYSFEAEEEGAARVTAVDGMGRTPEFDAEHARRGSSVRFVQGDVNDPATIEAAGVHDVVWSSGVLYHVPSPLLTIERLCSMTGERLLLQSATIPEVPGLPQACVLYPGLSEGDRRPYARVFPGAVALESPFEPDAPYSNWWWGITPSALRQMVAVQPGFEVTDVVARPLGTFVAARRSG